jgi:hypothetical protein
LWWGYLIDRDHLGDPNVNERLILTLVLKEIGWDSMTVFIWLKMGKMGDIF